MLRGADRIRKQVSILLSPLSARITLRSLLLLFVLVLAPASALGAQETPGEALPVREHTLENGLRLLVLPRPGAPTVAFVVEFPVGSVNERPGTTGIAHLLEHLFFKGTTTIGTRDYRKEAALLDEMDALQDSVLAKEVSDPQDTLEIRTLEDRIRNLEAEASTLVVSNEFDAILTENGAQSLNATTMTESTTYFVELPSNRTELWFVLEGDRMRNPVFREFYTERDVVAEERRMRLETEPSALLYEAHLAEAFRVHPYGTPVVGTMEYIQHLTRREVRDFFRTYYGPNNAVVAIVGDVDPRRILGWARDYLEPVPRGNAPPPVTAIEPPQKEERRVELILDAEPALRMGWKVPSARHPDAPALAMLASLLTGGRSSRLYRRLVIQDRVAANVISATGPGNLYPGLFHVDAMPLAPHTTGEVEAAIQEELRRLGKSPPDDMELQRVRNQLEASDVRRLSSHLGLALQLAESEALYGSWRRTFAFNRAMQAVTPEDIQRVVIKYFRDENLTVATLAKSREGEGGPG